MESTERGFPLSCGNYELLSQKKFVENNRHSLKTLQNAIKKSVENFFSQTMPYEQNTHGGGRVSLPGPNGDRRNFREIFLNILNPPNLVFFGGGSNGKGVKMFWNLTNDAFMKCPRLVPNKSPLLRPFKDEKIR